MEIVILIFGVWLILVILRGRKKNQRTRSKARHGKELYKTAHKSHKQYKVVTRVLKDKRRG